MVARLRSSDWIAHAACIALAWSQVRDLNWQFSWTLNLAILAFVVWKLHRSVAKASVVLIAVILASNLAQSVLLNWLVLGGLCLSLFLISRISQEERRWAFLGVVACWHPVASSLLLKWGNEWILALDAQWTTLLLQTLGYEVSAIGNLIKGAEHSVLVLSGCSSVHGLAEMGLITLAAGVWLNVSNRRMRFALAMAISLAVLLNGVRLATMTLSEELQVWWHAPAGERTYQGLMALIFFMLTMIQYGFGLQKSERSL